MRIKAYNTLNIVPADAANGRAVAPPAVIISGAVLLF
jgi:hypothetical protein